MTKQAVLLMTNDGYEALYVDNLLIIEGCPINQGYSRIKYFKGLAKDNGFNLGDMNEIYMTDEDDEEICEGGCFHMLLSHYSSHYNVG